MSADNLANGFLALIVFIQSYRFMLLKQKVLKIETNLKEGVYGKDNNYN